jgi:hypothetical protein
MLTYISTIAEAQYNIKATGHVAKLRRDLSGLGQI